MKNESCEVSNLFIVISMRIINQITSHYIANFIKLRCKMFICLKA